MNKEELAVKLDNAEYPFEPDKGLMETAKENNLVVIFGSSDDLMEFRGAIYDEIGCYGGEECYVSKEGLMPDIDELMDDKDIDKLRDYFSREPDSKIIESIWSEDGFSWTYQTEIPHETFEVTDEGEKYCKGIVFSIDDLK